MADRRETMLDELIVAMNRVHRRRRVVRRVGAAAVLTLALGVAWLIATPPPADDPAGGLAGRSLSGAGAPTIAVVTGSPLSGRIRLIDDGELVAQLARIDRPAGVIRAEGRAWVTDAVTDAELSRSEGELPTPPSL